MGTLSSPAVLAAAAGDDGNGNLTEDEAGEHQNGGVDENGYNSRGSRMPPEIQSENQNHHRNMDLEVDDDFAMDLAAPPPKRLPPPSRFRFQQSDETSHRSFTHPPSSSTVLPSRIPSATPSKVTACNKKSGGPEAAGTERKRAVRFSEGG